MRVVRSTQDDVVEQGLRNLLRQSFLNPVIVRRSS